MIEHFVELKDLERDKISLEGSFEPGVIDFSADNIRQVRPLVWNITAERVGEEIRIAGALNTTVEIACSRCLEPSRIEVSRPFDLFFRENGEAIFDEDDEIELDDKDTRTAFFSGTKLALSDVLKEQVLLALPMKVLCTLDCKGLCPTCGTNLNLKNCNCRGEQFKPHLDALLEIKRRMEEGNS